MCISIDFGLINNQYKKANFFGYVISFFVWKKNLFQQIYLLNFNIEL